MVVFVGCFVFLFCLGRWGRLVFVWVLVFGFFVVLCVGLSCFCLGCFYAFFGVFGCFYFPFAFVCGCGGCVRSVVLLWV